MVELASLGVLLFLAGAGFLVVELRRPGFLLGVPAAVLVALGVLAFTAPSSHRFARWAPLLFVTVALPATLVTLLLYRRLAPPGSRYRPASPGDLVGRRGRVASAVRPGSTRGVVRVEGATLHATTDLDAPIPVDAEVVVDRLEGGFLVVVPLEEPGTR